MASLRLVLVTCLAALVLAAVPNASAIVGGELDTTHPEVVFVGQIVFTPDGPVNANACSGTLVSSTVVVTAAHCGLVPPELAGFPQIFVVRKGENFRRPTAASIGRLVAHPDFAFGGNGVPNFAANDLAVVLLQAPLAGPFAQLPSLGAVDAIPTGTRLESVGYGISRLKGTQPLGDPVNWDAFRRVSEAKLLGGGVLGDGFVTINSGVCVADSGGPLLDGHVALAVNSFAPSPCKSVSYATRLDTASARAFLDDFVALP